MTLDEYRQMLQGKVQASPSLRAYAKEIGVSASILSLVITGKRPPSKAFLKKTGYRKVTEIVPLEEGANDATS